MNNFWIIIVGVCVLVIALLGIRYRNRKRRLSRQSVGVLWLQTLRQVLAGMQQHRGVSTGILKGDSSLKSKLDRLQNDIYHSIREAEAIDSWIATNENWAGIVAHWARLSKRYAELDVNHNLTQHGKIIRNILYVIEEMAEEHDLLNIANIHELGYDFIWKDLLETTEYMGQARAIGTGVAAAGVCGSVEKIRLNYLKEKIQSTTARIWTQIPHSDQSKNAVNVLLACLENKIVQNQPMMNASDYFAHATDAIDSLYREYDKVLTGFKL